MKQLALKEMETESERERNRCERGFGMMEQEDIEEEGCLCKRTFNCTHSIYISIYMCVCMYVWIQQIEKQMLVYLAYLFFNVV